MIITEPDLVQEFVKRILPGVLRAVKQLSPTEVLDDGKRGHVGVRICDGVIYVEQGASACYCQAEVYPAEFAKKKSPLREMLAEERLSAVVNYASATKWLQMAGKSVIEVEIVPGGGLRLMVIPGVMEMILPWSPEDVAACSRMAEDLGRHLSEGGVGPRSIPWEAIQEAGDPYVLAVSEAGGAEVLGGFVVGAEKSQVRLRRGQVPQGDISVGACEDPLGGRIVVVNSVAPHLNCAQFYRVLEI